MKNFEEKLIEMVGSESYQQYQKDLKKCYEDWQEIFPSMFDSIARYELDKEAYINTFFDPKHKHSEEFNEEDLIKLLRKNFKKAKHPIFIRYRAYLKGLLELSKETTQEPRIVSINDIIEIELLESVLETLHSKHESYRFLKESTRGIKPKSNDSLFALMQNLEEKGYLKLELISKNRNRIGELFFEYFGLASKAKDPFQKLRKYYEIAKTTRDFFDSMPPMHTKSTKT